MSPLATRVNEFLSEKKRKETKVHSKQEVDSIVDSLTGVLDDEGKSLREYKEDRLTKYENT